MRLLRLSKRQMDNKKQEGLDEHRRGRLGNKYFFEGVRAWNSKKAVS